MIVDIAEVTVFLIESLILWYFIVHGAQVAGKNEYQFYNLSSIFSTTFVNLSPKPEKTSIRFEWIVLENGKNSPKTVFESSTRKMDL